MDLTKNVAFFICIIFSFGSQKTLYAAAQFQVNGDVRLVDGTTPYEGRVEIYLNGQWGTVCDDAWRSLDAAVVCRQIGFGPVTYFTIEAFFGQGYGPIWLDDVACTGSESSLLACPHTDGAHHNCDHSKDAGAVCGPPSSPSYSACQPLSTVVTSPRNGHLNVSGNYVGDSGTVVCDAGYELSHDVTYLCETDGLWYIHLGWYNEDPTCDRAHGLPIYAIILIAVGALLLASLLTIVVVACICAEPDSVAPAPIEIK